MSAAVAGARARTPWQPIARKLPHVGASAARMARLMCDERFQRWLGHVLDDERVSVSVRHLKPPLVLLDLEADEGRLRVAVEEAALPPAVSMAFTLADRAAACEVAGILLTPVLERFKPLINRVKVRGFERVAAPRPGFRVVAAGHGAAVCGAEDRLMSHLLGMLHEIPASIYEWGQMKVRARLRLMVRRWTSEVLESLRPGDVALVGADDAQKLIVGSGFGMHAPAQISMQEERALVAGEISMDYDDAPSSGAISSDVEAVELPIVFEIDTARLSLAELSGVRPGYVIELDTALAEATVRLTCHGQVVGQGQLVAVGEQLGVRISRMGLGHGAAAER